MHFSCLLGKYHLIISSRSEIFGQKMVIIAILLNDNSNKDNDNNNDVNDNDDKNPQ